MSVMEVIYQMYISRGEIVLAGKQEEVWAGLWSRSDSTNKRNKQEAIMKG